jgi:ELWxxDGT repeat protein
MLNVKKKLLNSIFIAMLAIFGLSNVANAQQLVKDIRQGFYDSSPRNFISANGTLFFIADTTITGNNPTLWKTNGTATGTVRVSDKLVNNSGTYDAMVSLNGYLYFGAYDVNLGFELHKTDGTPEGTVMVKEIMTNNNPGFKHSGISHITAFNGSIYFSAEDGVNGRELWKSDGTAAGTAMVKDIRAGQYGSIDLSYFSNFEIVNNMLYFAAWNGLQGYYHELWKTDGTSSGTVPVKKNNTTNTCIYPHNLIEYNGNLYCSASNGQNDGYELYKSDGSDAGTVLLKDIRPGGYSSDPSKFKVANNLLFFTAYDDINGSELWKTDGTSAGTQMIKDIQAGINGAISAIGGIQNQFISFNNNLFFSAYNNINGTELWKSDGTADGTVLVKDIFSGTANGDPKSLTEMGGKLYFSGGDLFDQIVGTELWQSNGTAAGTVMLKDICPGKCGSKPIFLYSFNNTLFFQASGELWKFDESSTRVFENNKAHSNINIYPNPTSGIVNIKSSQAINTITVLDITGKIVYTQTANGSQAQLDLAPLNNGVYFIDTQLENGTINNSKVIISK